MKVVMFVLCIRIAKKKIARLTSFNDFSDRYVIVVV